MRLDQDNTRRLLPVFVFDMALQEPLLLDGWRQSVAFEDMVIVVRSSVATYTTYFQCNHGHVDIDLRELTRPILAAVAQSAWGVADTALHYSHGAGRDWNYLWSAGSTPFSPISAMATYSFVQVSALLWQAGCCGRQARTWWCCQAGVGAAAGGMCRPQLVSRDLQDALLPGRAAGARFPQHLLRTSGTSMHSCARSARMPLPSVPTSRPCLTLCLHPALPCARRWTQPGATWCCPPSTTPWRM